MANLRFSCGHCAAETRVEFVSVTGAREAQEKELEPHAETLGAIWSKMDEVTRLIQMKIHYRIFYSLVECPECHEFSAVKAVAAHSDLQGLVHPDKRGVDAANRVLLLEQNPHSQKSMPLEVPEDLSQVLLELEEDLSRGRNRGRILSGCRSLLDRALLELDGGTKSQSRVQRIERLASNGRLTTDIAEWAKKLWVEGHDGVHELRDPGHPIDEHMAFLRVFFEVVFVIPAKVASARRQQP